MTTDRSDERVHTMVSPDWLSWHEPYLEYVSPLSRRLRLVQRHIQAWLDNHPREELTAISACAGQGNDLLGVLASRPDASRLHAHLLEYDGRNVEIAQAARDAAGLTNVVVMQADAGARSSYRELVPADLVLMAGVFGNVSDGDVRRTIQALPELCAPGATVIWTRGRRAPDLTPAVRAWFESAGFVEEAFHAPDDVVFSVGVHRFAGQPRPLDPVGRLFTFLDQE